MAKIFGMPGIVKIMLVMLWSACKRACDSVAADDMIQMDLWVQNSTYYAKSAPD